MPPRSTTHAEREDNDRHAEDRALARAIAKGDEEAWRRFYHQYVDALFNFIMYRVNHEEATAQDLLQETLETAIKQCARFRGESALFTWLCGIARHKIQHHYRSLQRRGRWEVVERLDERLHTFIEAMDQRPLPDELLRREEVKQLINTVLSSLPPHYQQVLRGKYAQGRSLQELAGELALSIEAVESLLARARAAFRHGFQVLSEEWK